MYIECKDGDLTGDARIGRVKFSKSMKSIHYDGKTFQSLKGTGYKANFYETESGEHYWISGCKKGGADRLYGERKPIHIDIDAQEEYWKEIRNRPDLVGTTLING